ncbi:uncharacterized protein LOC111942910 isoform X1 [Cyanistes caeruleus]|uniref:uncharacterized protein LOC111942910 isoform X1 n=1 Tax=Cyanistes caeruleus TaxID=156563 RepID=UPI000CDA8D28|nr:uncharacterized protein LOC111942910 isoform X1 [Cyanistes caeruleus]
MGGSAGPEMSHGGLCRSCDVTWGALQVLRCHTGGSAGPVVSHRGLCRSCDVTQGALAAPQRHKGVSAVTPQAGVTRASATPAGLGPLTGAPHVSGEPLPRPVLVTWSATDSAMGILSVFTVGELLAMTMVVLQLILVTVTLRDKRLWRIRQNSKHPSAARGRLQGQSDVDRARRSADMELQPHGSSPGSSISSRSRFPRFIRSCRDSRALFEEQREELEAQLAQRPRMPRGCGAAQSSVPVEPGLLGGRESPRAGEGRPRASSGPRGQRGSGTSGRT